MALDHLTAEDVFSVSSRDAAGALLCPCCARPGLRVASGARVGLLLACPHSTDPCKFKAIVQEVRIRLAEREAFAGGAA